MVRSVAASVLSFFKLIRFGNLLMIALIQYLVRYCLIGGMLQNSGLNLQQDNFDFFLLSLSTVMLAAAGYIINDYFDTQIDRVNKPHKVIVGRTIKRRVAMGAHIVITFISITLGFYLSNKAGMFKIGFVHLFSAGFLWFYSTDFKKQPVLGNLVVAMLAALVPLIVGLYEIPLIIKKYRQTIIDTGIPINHIFYFVAAYSGFAFLSTFIREVIKDMEDYIGDKEFGRNTIPIAFGMRVSKFISIACIVFTMLLLAYPQYNQWQAKDTISFYYFLCFLQIPYFFLLLKIYTATETKNYHFASRISKLIMLFGILYTVVIWYLYQI